MSHPYRTRLLIMLAVLVGIAPLMAGCARNSAPSQQPANSGAQQPSPGGGKSMADQLNEVLKPVPGEGISVDIDNAETGEQQYLMDRLQAAKDTHPALFVGIQYVLVDVANGKGNYGFTFQDGSKMLWVAKPSPKGSQGPLDHVEITRP